MFKEGSALTSLGFIIFTILILCSDHIDAFLWSQGSQPITKSFRDIIVVAILPFGIIFLLKHNKYALMPSLNMGYLLLLFGFLILSQLNGNSFGSSIRHAAILAIPIIYFNSGVFWQKFITREQLLIILSLFGLLSCIFSLWEINNISYWMEFLRYGNYLAEVKGVTSFDTQFNLPFNFHRHYNDGSPPSRRTAGLVAAPLAHGHILLFSLSAFLMLSHLKTISRSLFLLLIIFFIFSLTQNQTRGAILSLVLLFFALFLKNKLKVNTSVIFMLFLFSGLIGVLTFILLQISPQDGSWSGHTNALLKNINDILNSNVLGHGLGVQGSLASMESSVKIGGGEGSIFTIYFQIGILGLLLIGSIIYLAFRQFYSLARSQSLFYPETTILFYFSLFTLLVGMLTSEILLTVSGSGIYWVLIGFYYQDIKNFKKVNYLKK